MLVLWAVTSSHISIFVSEALTCVSSIIEEGSISDLSAIVIEDGSGICENNDFVETLIGSTPSLTTRGMSWFSITF